MIFAVPPVYPLVAPEFDFDAYVMKQAKIVEKALSESVPLQYPEKINEVRRERRLGPNGTRQIDVLRQSGCRDAPVRCEAAF